jgi:hypothetical protein
MMNTNPYQLRGGHVPNMFGRKALLEQVFQQLTKPDPVHLSVVGPQLSGKTVFLTGLAGEIIKKTDNYLTVIYRDFRQMTPQTDKDFKIDLAKRIREKLKDLSSEAAEYIDETGSDILGDICLAVDEIRGQNKRILVIFDGFDHVLASDRLTRNLWDNLCDLADKPGICFVTGSRKRLRELLKHNARPSIFWERFYQKPMVIGRFDETDLDDLLLPFKKRNISFDSAAVKELMNETGGNSVLTIGLLHHLYNQAVDNVEIDGERIKKIGEEASEKYREILSELWEDCSLDIRSDLAALAKGELSVNDILDDRQKILENQGFVKIAKNKIKISCRIFKRYTDGQWEGVTYIQRLFSTPEGFQLHIKSLLELRLAQLANDNEDLKSYIQQAIGNLQPNPSHAIQWARSIVMRALDIIWEKELDPGKRIPGSWTNDWKNSEDEKYWKPYYDTGELPQELGHQCALLDKITGTKYNKRTAKYVSKSSYPLISFLNSVGDFGQHRNEKVSLGYAAAVCFAAIELCNNLSHELTPRRGDPLRAAVMNHS